MVWIIKDADEAEAIKEISTLSDRAAAILAGALVEARIEQFIRDRMIEDDTVQGEMFRTSGPLGSFSSKIKIAYLMKLYEIDLYKDLEIFKDIRNEFAHKARAKDFGSQRVRDLTKNFKLIEVVVVDGTDVQHDRKHRMQIAIVGADEKKKDPRQRYLISSQIFLLALSGGNRWGEFKVIDS